MNDKHLLLAWAVKNSICIICFTVLAIVINKWWVILFAMLFMDSIATTVKGYYRICDSCGKNSPYAKSYEDGIEKAKESGWIHMEDGKDYCPECQKKMLV